MLLLRGDSLCRVCLQGSLPAHRQLLPSTGTDQADIAAAFQAMCWEDTKWLKLKASHHSGYMSCGPGARAPVICRKWKRKSRYILSSPWARLADVVYPSCVMSAAPCAEHAQPTCFRVVWVQSQG